MSKKLLCLIFCAMVVMAAPVEAVVEPVASVVITQVDNPDGVPSFMLESITVGGYTVAVADLVTGTSAGVATAQPAPYDDITVADNFDLNLFAGRANEDPPTHQITELGGQPTWTDTNGDNPDFFVFETGGNQPIDIEAILPGGVIGQSVTVPTATWGDTGYSITNNGPHNGQSISGIAFAITDLLDESGNNLSNSSVIEGIQISSDGYDPTCVCAVSSAESGVTIVVEAGGDIAAANETAKAGDTIEIAEGTFILTEQIEIKDGVTYHGSGAGLTIIDGNDTTRAFVAWGDRSATNGQVDADGNGVPNNTGPKDWVLEGMTIQNCVADTADRQDILSAARDLLNNYTGAPYTLATAQEENGGITSNPEWFDILSGSADDDLTDAELQAYLDANPIGSAGHLVVNNDKSGDGGAITIDNGARGTIQNCDFINNHTPAGGGDDGGAINITGLSVVTIDDCWFDGNYAVSPDSVAVEGSDGDGGHIKVQGSSASAITPGTTLVAKRSVFLNGNASDDGGAIQSSAVGIVIRLDACWFEGNTSWDNGNVCQFSSNAQHEVTVTNCIFVNNVTKADNSPDRMIETNRNSKFVNCTFVGNNQEDQDLIYNNANTQDTNGDGVDDETADVTQVVNCIFANNVVGNGDDVLGSRNDDFTIAATNCLFFGNTLQNGNAADNTQRPDNEAGSIEADPLLDVVHVPQPGSPAIDAGVDPATVGVTLTTDLDGNPRPQGAGYDIGAYEVTAN